MNISIVGTGYVGLVTGVCLAIKGHEVISIEKRHDIIRKINNGVCPIYEPKLAELLSEAVKDKKLIATTDIEFAVNNTDITIVALDAPFKDDAIDLSNIESYIREIGSMLEEKESYHVVCIRSTVLPSTTQNNIKDFLEQASQKQAGSFGLAVNPEFLRQGSAVDDFMNPDRIIIGAYDDKSFDMVAEVYEDCFDVPILKTNLNTAEMIKYAANTLWASLESFSNEISGICESIGDIDALDILNGLITDKAIAIRNKNKYIIPGMVQYLRPSCGFGGGYLSSEIKGLIAGLTQKDYKAKILESVLEVNQKQPLKMINKLESILGDISNKKIAVLGISYMADTDDISESPAVIIINELLAKGALVYASDPQAIPNAKKELGDKSGLKLVKNCKDALRDADAVLIVTAWNEYKKLKPKDFVKLMKKAVIIDGKRIYDSEEMESLDIVYTGIGINK